MASWYKASRKEFLQDDINKILGHLHGAAASDGWYVEPDQDEEWRSSLENLQETLREESSVFIEGILAEYDFRRRGLRIDFVLVAPGALFVLEFKRGVLSAGDRDQVMNYCVNLVEFHELTQLAKAKLFPVLVSGKSVVRGVGTSGGWHPDWPQIRKEITCTNPDSLGGTLRQLWEYVSPGVSNFTFDDWDRAAFQPSSTIIDASISLFGQHEVSAMKAHAVPKEEIDRCVASVIAEIDDATKNNRRELILVSGAPGAGKTLVGLAITFHERYRGEAVFVTGNAPLVEVLNGSLQRSYKRLRNQDRARPLGGYTRTGRAFVERNADFKIVKAPRFLEHARGGTRSDAFSADGRILVFDEAQRTYSAGTQVNRRRLEEDEAKLILTEMSRREGSIIVLLLGHNQHINAKEMGVQAWLNAAKEHGWVYAVSDATLALEEFESNLEWANHKLRREIEYSHLAHSLRDQRTRNGEIERWAHYVMTNSPKQAEELAKRLPTESTIHITRSLLDAKRWVRNRRIGSERGGLIASGQGHRLRAEGIYVDEKPDIVEWMLADSEDVRSSNMLEQTQNQYQIQGLEIDYAIVCWDADFRRVNGTWACYSISGRGWQRRANEDEARCNSYRVLLTRSRKGMVVFVPSGDLLGKDPTRDQLFYDGIAGYIECGAQPLVLDASDSGQGQNRWG